MLPSSTIATSPIEFSFIGNTASPLSYIKTAFFTATGFFLVWPIAIYFLFDDKVKKILSFIMPLLFFTALANAYIFRLDSQTVDITFTIGASKEMSVISMETLLIQLMFFIALSFAILFMRKKKRGLLTLLIFSVCVAEGAFSLTKVRFIGKSFSEHKTNMEKSNQKDALEASSTKINPIFHLSRTGKNVMVIFLDRSISSFLEPAFLDLPELKEQLRGCTFYPETLSFGPCTVLASPQLLAGYEYTPQKINARKDKLLKDKHNEALLVMPTLFAEGGFHSTFIDPPFANYHWKGDLSPFKGKKNIDALEIMEQYTKIFDFEHGLKPTENMDKEVHRGLKDFVAIQILPQAARILFNKFCRNKGGGGVSYYLKQFPNLYYFDRLTDFSAMENQFFLIVNDTTHAPQYLKQDFIIPAINKEERAKTLFQCNDKDVMQHYHVFLASLKAIGRYFDYLRENGCFDNTRIIIVSDHGWNLPLPRFAHFKNIPSTVPSSFNPFFLVKDFDSNDEFKTDRTFMTNADTILFAKKDLPLSDKNPLTGVEFRSEKENGITCYGVHGTEWNGETMRQRKQTTLLKENGYRVKGDIFDEESWTPLTKLYNGGEK